MARELIELLHGGWRNVNWDIKEEASKNAAIMTKIVRQYRHKWLVVAHRVMRRMFHFLGPTVGTNAVVEHEGRILLIRRAENDKLDVPGGLVHWGETLEDACRREVLEETGYDIEIVELIGVYSWVRPSYCNISVSYVGKLVGGEQRHSSEGDPVWLLPPFRAEDFHMGVERFVLDYLDGQRGISASRLRTNDIDRAQTIP